MSLVDSDSYYWQRQSLAPRASRNLLGLDFEEVMESLNAKEDHVGIARTTWHSDFEEQVVAAKYPHMAVSIPGVSGVSYLREAVDRVRLAGGWSAFPWSSVPSKAEWLTDKTGKKCFSIIHILELKEAIGRFVADSAISVADYTLKGAHVQRSDGSPCRQEAVSLGASPRAVAYIVSNLYEEHGDSILLGGYSHRASGGPPIEDHTILGPDGEYIYGFQYPAITDWDYAETRNYFPQPTWDCIPEAFPALGFVLASARISGFVYDLAAVLDAYESYETANPSKWSTKPLGGGSGGSVLPSITTDTTRYTERNSYARGVADATISGHWNVTTVAPYSIYNPQGITTTLVDYRYLAHSGYTDPPGEIFTGLNGTPKKTTLNTTAAWYQSDADPLAVQAGDFATTFEHLNGGTALVSGPPTKRYLWEWIKIGWPSGGAGNASDLFWQKFLDDEHNAETSSPYDKFRSEESKQFPSQMKTNLNAGIAPNEYGGLDREDGPWHTAGGVYTGEYKEQQNHHYFGGTRNSGSRSDGEWLAWNTPDHTEAIKRY